MLLRLTSVHPTRQQARRQPLGARYPPCAQRGAICNGQFAAAPLRADGCLQALRIEGCAGQRIGALNRNAKGFMFAVVGVSHSATQNTDRLGVRTGFAMERVRVRNAREFGVSAVGEDDLQCSNQGSAMTLEMTREIPRGCQLSGCMATVSKLQGKRAFSSRGLSHFISQSKAQHWAMSIPSDRLTLAGRGRGPVP